MSRMHFTRRRFLNSLGVSTAVGFLPLLDATSSRAESLAPPRRLVVFKWTSGAHPPQFWPASLAEDLSKAPLPPILESLEPWKKHVNIYGGVDYTCMEEQRTTKKVGEEEGHSSSPIILTGWGMAEYGDPGIQIANGPSLDQVLGYEIIKTQHVKFPVLNLAGRDPGSQNVIWRAARQPVSRDRNPAEVYKKVFGGLSIPEDAFDQIKAQRRSVLDYVGKELESFGRRLGSEDRIKIEQHIESVRHIERQLSFDQKVSCTLPETPNPDEFLNGDYDHPVLWEKKAKLVMDLAHAALACDVTRVITIELTSPDGEDNRFVFLPQNDPLHGVGMHTLNHAAYDPQFEALRVRSDKFMWSMPAYFVKKLAETPEGGGSMLDNTIVLVTNLMGDIHRIRSLPFVTIGNARRYLKTGRYLRYGEWASAPSAQDTWRAAKLRSGLKYRGVPHNGLLVALANAVGVPMETFGDPQYGGELAGIRG